MKARRPTPWLTLREIPRTALELGTFVGSRRRLMRSPKANGDPVLVLPGFTASDASTLALRRLLRRVGYHVHAWRLGRNWGPTDRVVDGLRDRVASLVTHHGRPLHLIGHSLGGIYAREIARAAPEAVRQVITLGSPLRRPEKSSGPAAPLFRALGPLHSHRVNEVDDQVVAEPIEVPLTAIFTRSDGVVPWRTCVVEAGRLVCNVEVKGSHSGLIHNPAAVSVILDRLAGDPNVPYRERPGIDARLWTQ